MIQLHLDSLGKVIENLGCQLLGQPFFPWLCSLESLNLKDLKLWLKKLALSSCVHFGPSFKDHVYHTHFIGVLVCYFQIVCFFSQFLTWGQARS